METRISSRFVIDSRTINEVDSLTSLNDLIMASLGSSASGRLLDITVTVKTSTDKPWTVCQELGYYGTDPCGALVRPGTLCLKDHYHRPMWLTNKENGEQFCQTCNNLGITPSREYQEPSRYTYNHRNVPQKSDD